MEQSDLIWDIDEEKHKVFVDNLAPIVLFTYNRLDHTKQTIKALQKNVYAPESVLYIYSDAPKNEKAAEAVRAVRDYLHTVTGFKEIHITEREENWGLARNIIDGVTKIINKYGKIIVLEDDIVTSKWFLKYMNDGLELYKNNPKVMAISGFTEPIKNDDLPDTFFLPRTSCWGWATWGRLWKDFKRNPEELVNKYTFKDIKKFNLDGAFDFWSQVVGNYEGKLHTWAIFFYSTVFEKNGLVLYSKYSLSRNIGLDNSGEHCGRDDSLREMQMQTVPVHFSTNMRVEESPEISDRFKNFFKHRNQSSSKIRRAIRKIKDMFLFTFGE